MRKYYSTRVSEKEFICGQGCGGVVMPGDRYLRVFFPPDDVIPCVIVGKVCRACAPLRGQEHLFV